MKIKSIFSGLGVVLFLHGGLFSATAAPAVQSYNWNYWSYEFGAGVGYVSSKIPTIEHSSEVLAPSSGSTMPVKMKLSGFPMVDFRLGLEKSWHFAEKLTATLDWALLTPAFTVGYLISPRTRLYIGAHYSVFLNSGRVIDSFSTETHTQSTTYRQADGVEVTKEHGVRQTLHMKPRFFYLSPRAGVDFFISSRTLLRVNLSCDWSKVNAEQQVQGSTACLEGGSIFWPQLTISLKKFF